MAKFWKDSFEVLNLNFDANYASKLRTLVRKYAQSDYDEKSTVAQMLRVFFRTLKDLAQLVDDSASTDVEAEDDYF